MVGPAVPRVLGPAVRSLIWALGSRLVPGDPADLLVTIAAEDVFDAEPVLHRDTAPTLVIGGGADPHDTEDLFRRPAASVPITVIGEDRDQQVVRILADNAVGATGPSTTASSGGVPLLGARVLQRALGQTGRRLARKAATPSTASAPSTSCTIAAVARPYAGASGTSSWS
jgi:hypothetical protein